MGNNNMMGNNIMSNSGNLVSSDMIVPGCLP